MLFPTHETCNLRNCSRAVSRRLCCRQEIHGVYAYTPCWLKKGVRLENYGNTVKIAIVPALVPASVGLEVLETSVGRSQSIDNPNKTALNDKGKDTWYAENVMEDAPIILAAGSAQNFLISIHLDRLSRPLLCRKRRET